MNSTIRALRKQKGMTQADLAEAAGLSIRTIQRLESGETEVKGHSLNSLRKVFGEEFGKPTSIPDQIRVMNLLALTFMPLPFLNLILLYRYWSKHRFLSEMDVEGRQILNFQIEWYLGISLLAIILVMIQPFLNFNGIFWGCIGFALLNLWAILRAARRLNQNQKPLYPKLLSLF